MFRMIAGLPEWLKSIGLLDWLSRLDPLDKWLGILAAVLIGLYAIFHETLWAWTRRPKLKILPNLSCIGIPVNFHDREGTLLGTADSFHIQVVITNEGKSRAESVEVYAKQLSRQENRGTAFVECPWFLPMNLVWANEESAYTGISPKMERFSSIGAIMNPPQADLPQAAIPHAPASFNYGTTCTFRVHTVVRTSSYSSWVFPGSYRLDLAIAAANVKPQEVSVFLKFDGRWFPDKEQIFGEALQVSLDPPKG